MCDRCTGEYSSFDIDQGIGHKLYHWHLIVIRCKIDWTRQSCYKLKTWLQIYGFPFWINCTNQPENACTSTFVLTGPDCLFIFFFFFFFFVLFYFIFCKHLSFCKGNEKACIDHPVKPCSSFAWWKLITLELSLDHNKWKQIRTTFESKWGLSLSQVCSDKIQVLSQKWVWMGCQKMWWISLWFEVAAFLCC